MLVASPTYLEQHGIPDQPEDLKDHRCLVMERLGEPLNEWQFHIDQMHQTIKVEPVLISNDGAIIRQWALAGSGIAYKSIWDVKHDLTSGKLQTILDDFVLGFQESDKIKTGLQLLYPSRQYLPGQVAGFIEFLQTYLSVET